MITKTFGTDFRSDGGALTLPSDVVGKWGHVWKIHPSGWAIRGEIVEDWSSWVNEFEAVHPVFGKVWGNFESKVFASSENAFENFWHYHCPEDWDYRDI